MLRQWDDLPDNMRTESVRPYYDALAKKRLSLRMMRCFDVIAGLLLTILLSPILLALIIAVKVDSKGPAFFRQTRVTQYGRRFRIVKYRTMVTDAEKLGAQVTVFGDARITRVGAALRRNRLDELPQLFNIIAGDMSFVGMRPEVEKYVQHYSDEMMATLLLPAGVTSQTSILYKDEDRLMRDAENADDTYIHKVLPDKMKYNLENVMRFSLMGNLCVLLLTLKSIFLSEEEGMHA